MAIKGKKKSQSRGSQARRRPAAAPRPALVTRGRVPWYRTPGGRVALAVAIVLAVSAVGGIIAVAGSDAGLEARQRRLQAYTQQIRTLRAQITVPASQMAGAPMSPRQKGFKRLGNDALRWVGVFGQAQPSADSLAPPDSISTTATLFSKSVETYAAAAQMFEVATTLEEAAQMRLIGLAATERERALELWSTALAELESARSDAEMDPSGLQPPATATEVQPPVPPATDAGGGGNQDGGGKNENKKNKNNN
jgi:hypothetical protein